MPPPSPWVLPNAVKPSCSDAPLEGQGRGAARDQIDVGLGSRAVRSDPISTFAPWRSSRAGRAPEMTSAISLASCASACPASVDVMPHGPRVVRPDLTPKSRAAVTAPGGAPDVRPGHGALEPGWSRRLEVQGSGQLVRAPSLPAMGRRSGWWWRAGAARLMCASPDLRP